MKIHSIESMGTVDGPGVRTVVFMQGCKLRCGFCHNPDALELIGGTDYTPEQLFDKIFEFKEYWGSDGGVTLTGGEPLVQYEELKNFVDICKENKVNVAIDTAAWCNWETIREFIGLVDLWMISIKHPVESEHINLIGHSGIQIKENISQLSKLGQKIRIRYIIIPGLTDGEANLNSLTSFLDTLQGVIELELLAFNKMGKSKGRMWQWDKYPEATKDNLLTAKTQIGTRHYKVIV